MYMFRAISCSSSGGQIILARRDDWLTVHRSITLVDFQLDAQNSYIYIYIYNQLRSYLNKKVAAPGLENRD